MLQWLKRYLGLDDLYKELRSNARLSESEAHAIAEKESKQQGLLFADLTRKDSSLVWVFRTSSVGSWLIVQIDDSTGQLLGVDRQGKR
jgi:hypothetical protein